MAYLEEEIEDGGEESESWEEDVGALGGGVVAGCGVGGVEGIASGAGSADGGAGAGTAVGWACSAADGSAGSVA